MTKYFLYARKSTDDEDRQLLSIDAQIAELKEFASKENLHIAQTFIESKTAKEPGRAVFNDMLAKVEAGKAEGILSWHPDRLARNSVDGGRIIYLIDTGKLKALKFPTFWFESTPQGKFMLSIAFGQSKYYVDNLSENVRRGLRQKVRRGELPGWAPIGYLNDLKSHRMVPDPEKFSKVRHMFVWYATADYSFKDIQQKLVLIGLLSRTGKPLSLSNIQALLKNPFYYGAFLFNGELHEGSHEPMIPKKLFEEVQRVMEERSSPKKRGARQMAFLGIFRCGECGCAVTAESQKGYIYYHCTKKKGPCSQKSYLREERLAELVSDELQKVSLPDAWAQKMLAKLDGDETASAQALGTFAQNLKSQISGLEEKLNKLLDLKLEGLITAEEFTTKKNELLSQKLSLTEKLRDFERKGDHWLELCRAFILQSQQAKLIALSGHLDERAKWLKRIGSNFIVEGRKIKSGAKNPWALIANSAQNANVRSGTWFTLFSGDIVYTMITDHGATLWPTRRPNGSSLGENFRLSSSKYPSVQLMKSTCHIPESTSFNPTG